ncbi:MAG: UvrD-helicase domain-containing protein [Lachnospiraceae bacterium]|nr:UvrD-helicase domain-containing protein [Lachnospiraceae bacterium]
MNLDRELNKEQALAVRQTEGPVLILAGAGSGKTRTIVYRMAYLLTEEKVDPWNILAVTFTNKAANEMKERIREMAGPGFGQMNVSTFHSACLKILFTHAEKLGYPLKFEIADTTDQKSVIKEVYEKLGLDPKRVPVKAVINKISAAKVELMDPAAYAETGDYDFVFNNISTADIYREYQALLMKNGMMDFDDMIMNTVRLFREYPDVLEKYQERFKYIMVDEYQDTNTSQFELIRLLSEKYRNLCVVGDDDQSIYRFRGANIYNILDFERYYPDAFTVRLEENYRSTSTILDAANAVIKNNTERKVKALWTEGKRGDRIKYRKLNNPRGEADFIADEIRDKVKSGKREYGDFAILTRTNIQSKELEDALRVRNIEYDVVKGLKFWDTKVIKDLTSYLMTVDSAVNDMRVRRIINVPKRGIGKSTIDKITMFAAANNMTFFEALFCLKDIGGIPAKAKNAVAAFTDMILKIREDSKDMCFSAVLNRILEESGYMDYLFTEMETPDKYKEQKEYIQKLRETLDAYEEEAEIPDLTDFMRINGLEGNNLDKSSDGDSRNKVLIMTMHNAKGLEFPEVYMAGMEEGLFPGYASINSGDRMDIEEERRLCYVGITRAKENLTMTSVWERMINGEWRRNTVSRFVEEIPEDLIDMNEKPKKNTETIPHVSNDRPLKSVFSLDSIKKGSDMQKTLPAYKEGDRVRHFKFGIGTVISITDAGRDYEVMAEFEEIGVRKMMAGFAKLKKL